MKTLGKVAKDAYERDGATWEAVAEAVAAHVRAEDAARGGMLSAETFGVIEDRFVAGEATNEDVGAVLTHAAAQGRTIAAKDARIAELEAEVREERQRAKALEQAVRGVMDDAVATLAKMPTPTKQHELFANFQRNLLNRVREELERALAAVNIYKES